jgi:hypothetical protein
MMHGQKTIKLAVRVYGKLLHVLVPNRETNKQTNKQTNKLAN